MEAIGATPQSSRLVPIAPAPVDRPFNPSNPTQAVLMPFSCQPCSKRKIKCNKAVPECSSCRKSKLECSYSAPQSRQRSKKLIGDLHEKLARYEHVLRQHGLLDAAKAQPTAGKSSQDPVISLRWEDSTASNEGRLLAGHGKSRYIETYTWQSLDQDDETQSVYEGEYEEEEDKRVDMGYLADSKLVSPSDPLTGVFLGSTELLEHYHPTHETAMALWEYHTQNVEPLCKILHIPSTGLLIETFSKHPTLASKADECLLFSIYHFAVYSMSEEDCSKVIGEDLSRKELIRRFHFATCQALVNASFLKTTDFKVLQAFVLFLLSCRFHYDPATYWSLTGVALRVAQRMGLDRDGEVLGLPPFEVQMRRRLLYQVVPLDGVSRQAVGVGPVSFTKIASDSKQPLNVDDDQIWPGMETSPEESFRRGATEMIFCLTRSHLGRFVNGLSRPGSSPANLQFRDYQEADKAISEAESEIEEKYIRYCDVVNPLHFLTMANARSAITSWRLRARFPKIKNKTATEKEKKEVFLLAGKILDTDAAVYACPGIQRFWWFIRSIFLWGTWDSLIYVLNMLYTEPGLLSAKETEEQWLKIQRIYENHNDLLEVRNARHVAIGLQALKAWEARFAHVEGSDSAGGFSVSELPFITSLRLQREERRRKREEKREQANRYHKTEAMGLPTGAEGSKPKPSQTGHHLGVDPEPVSGYWSPGEGLDLDMDFDLDATDWTFWEQLTQRG